MEANKNPIILTKKITRADSGNARLISLPRKWINERGDPDKVIVLLGDLLIIGVEGDEQRIQEIVDLLDTENLIKPITDSKHQMRFIGVPEEMEEINV